MRLLIALILIGLFVGGNMLGKERKNVKAYEPPKWIDDVLVANGHKMPSGDYVKKPETDEEDFLDFEAVDKEKKLEKEQEEKQKQEKMIEKIRENWLPEDDEGRVETA